MQLREQASAIEQENVELKGCIAKMELKLAELEKLIREALKEE